MNVSTVVIDKEVAKEKYKEYLEAEKKVKSKEYSAARRAYRALSKGFKVIDIYAAFEKTGLKTNGTPKLAIVRADSREVFFTKLENGAGRFQKTAPQSWGNQPYLDHVDLPAGTFKDWETELVGVSDTNQGWNIIKEPEITTNVPTIPPSVTVTDKLEKYYILFEVSQWKATATVKDPYLLQRLSPNMFVVLAEWDVSPVEAIAMRS